MSTQNHGLTHGRMRKSSAATADSATKLSADEPGDRLRQNAFAFDYAGLADESGEAKDKSTLAKPEAQRESNWAKTGHKGTTALAVGLH